MSGPSSPVLTSAKDPAYAFSALVPRATPSAIDHQAEEKRALLTNIALTVLALSIVSTFALVITCCVITVPFTPLIASIGTIFVSAISSVVLYSNNNVVDLDDFSATSTGLPEEPTSSGLIGLFFPKKATIIGTKATPAQVQEASFKLSNPANNCFMHATLQLIFQDRDISDYFMQALDAIGRNDDLADKNPALEISGIEIGNHNLYHGMINGSQEYDSIEALEAKIAQKNAEKEAIEANQNFAKYKIALLAHKEAVARLKRMKAEQEASLRAPKVKGVSDEDHETSLALLAVSVVETATEIERLEKNKFVLKQERPADADPGAAELPDIDLSAEYTQFTSLVNELELLQKKHSSWTKFNNLSAEHKAEIDAKIAAYKAINKEAIYAKGSILAEDLTNLYYAFSLKDAGMKAHELLTKWRATKILSTNESKILRVCLVKLIQEKSILHIPQEPKQKKFFSLEEMRGETHPGTEVLKYTINDEYPTNIVVIEKNMKGMPINACVLFRDETNPLIFRDSKKLPVFATKEQASTHATRLLEAEKRHLAKFKLRNACDLTTIVNGEELSSISYSYTSQDESSKLFEELTKSLLSLNPDLACPFLPKAYGQTKRSTYDDEALVEGAHPYGHEETIEDLCELATSTTIRVESQQNTIDLAQDIKKGFEKHITRKPDSAYVNSGASFKEGITRGREYFTEYFKWVDLPKKLIISPNFGDYKLVGGTFKSTLVPKALNFTDNENLIIDLSSVGEKPDGQKTKGGKYILNGFTLKTGSESGGHYVYYSRRYGIEGDVSTSYWIINNDDSTSSVSCEAVTRLLLNRNPSSFPNTLIFDQVKEAAEEPAVAGEE